MNHFPINPAMIMAESMEQTKKRNEFTRGLINKRLATLDELGKSLSDYLYWLLPQSTETDKQWNVATNFSGAVVAYLAAPLTDQLAEMDMQAEAYEDYVDNHLPMPTDYNQILVQATERLESLQIQRQKMIDANDNDSRSMPEAAMMAMLYPLDSEIAATEKQISNLIEMQAKAQGGQPG